VGRRAVRVQLDRRSAVVSGPRVDVALRVTAARWHWHETSKHRSVRVHLDDVDDVIAALEHDDQRVEIVNRDGYPVAFGGLLGGAE
jgi:hypothetical protein